jgi:hypothetical protein
MAHFLRGFFEESNNKGQGDRFKMLHAFSKGVSAKTNGEVRASQAPGPGAGERVEDRWGSGQGRKAKGLLMGY